MRRYLLYVLLMMSVAYDLFAAPRDNHLSAKESYSNYDDNKFVIMPSATVTQHYEKIIAIVLNQKLEKDEEKTLCDAIDKIFSDSVNEDFPDEFEESSFLKNIFNCLGEGKKDSIKMFRTIARVRDFIRGEFSDAQTEKGSSKLPFSKLFGKARQDVLDMITIPEIALMEPNPFELTQNKLKEIFPEAKSIRMTAGPKGKSGAQLHEVFVVHGDGTNKKYMVRCAIGILGQNRIDEENLIAERMGEIGVAPRVYYRKDGILVMDRIETDSNNNRLSGRSPKDINNENDESFMQALRIVHDKHGFELGGQGKKSEIGIYSIFDRTKRSYSRIWEGFLDPEDQKLLNRIVDISDPSVGQRLTLTHGDAHIGNATFDNNNRFFLYDWELAGVDHPFKDIAYYSVLSSKSFEGTKNLLASYLGKLPTAEEIERLQKFKCIACGFLATATLDLCANLAIDIGLDVKSGVTVTDTAEEIIRGIDDNKIDIRNLEHLYRFGLAFLRASKEVKLMSEQSSNNLVTISENS